MVELTRRSLVLLVLSLLFAGCASQRAPMQLNYGIEQMQPGDQRFFPPPPETPRFMYGGELIGEQNFSALLKVEPGFWEKVYLFITGLAGNEVFELNRPQGVLVDEFGRVYVADVTRGAVVIFDKVAGELRVVQQATMFGKFSSPIALARSESGELFVTDSDLAIVARLRSQGLPGEPIGAGLLGRPTGIAYDPEQKLLFVADTAVSDIKIFDLEGRLVRTLGRFGSGPGEFNRPTHLAFWNGELYVSDTLNARIQVLDAETGEFLRVIGKRGVYVGQLERPKGIAVDSQGRLYVIESYNDHLLIFDRDGKFLLPIGGTGFGSDRFYLPAGIWIDRDDRIYIADMFNGRVVSYISLVGEAEGGPSLELPAAGSNEASPAPASGKPVQAK